MMLSWTRGRLLSSVGQVCSSSGAHLPQKRENVLSSSCERSHLQLTQQRGNCNRAALGSIRREKYLRVYPVRLVRPDGSSITIRMKEPRRLAYLPVDMTTLSEQELRERLAARKPQMLINKTDENLDDNFDPDEYSFIWSENEEKERQKSSKESGKLVEANKAKETTGKGVEAKSKDAGKTAKTKSKESTAGVEIKTKEGAQVNPKEAAKGAEAKVKAKKSTKEELNVKETVKDAKTDGNNETKKRPQADAAIVNNDKRSGEAEPKKMTG